MIYVQDAAPTTTTSLSAAVTQLIIFSLSLSTYFQKYYTSVLHCTSYLSVFSE